MSATPEPHDRNTARLLRRLDRPLHVLADPGTATSLPRPADAPDLLHLRTLARDVRQHTLDHLDGYLDLAQQRIESAGGTFSVAPDAIAARRLIAELGGPCSPRVMRSPLSDEIGLGRVPSGPGGERAWHGFSTREEHGLKTRATQETNRDAVTGSDRTALADGDVDSIVVAATFLVAETGQVCLASDDAALATASAATTLICIAGIESVVPRVADLAIMLKLLARAASGRPMTAYTALLDPARAGRSLHVVLLDNGRSDLLAGEFRPVLRCIGCGACTNACPVYRSTGVGPDGLWAGLIGAITLARLRPDAGTVELPHASTLCGACADVCPVRIDLPAHLIALRARSPRLSIRLRLWGWCMLSPMRFRWARRLRRRRAMWPVTPKQSFGDLWRERGRR